MAFGDIPSPDDCYLTLRGLRSLGVRLRHHQASGLRVAQWLQQRPEVKRVLYPPLPADPGRALWQRDFTGACSLFGVVLHTPEETAVAQMVEGYRYFKIGASWGGVRKSGHPRLSGGAPDRGALDRVRFCPALSCGAGRSRGPLDGSRRGVPALAAGAGGRFQ
jgi:cystathionine beta-lyase